MRVLVLHSYYKQRGGEESSLEADLSLMDRIGIERDLFTEENDRADTLGRLQLAITTVWSAEAARRLRRRLSRKTYDIAHVHNTFPMMSGAVYHILKEFRIPVVQTLHNYRLVCTNGLLFRANRVCEDCVGRRIPFPSLHRACYHRGTAANAVVAGQMIAHRGLKTYRNKVDTYLALTSFARDLFIRSGWNRDRILIRPNFIEVDPGVGDGQGGFALFAGRLSEEKGIPVLIDGWLRSRTRRKLRIVGDGPMRSLVERVARENANIEYLGFRSREEVLQQLKHAAFLVFPSVWYEGMPMTILESFAVGTPVLAFRIGAMSEMIAAGRSGWLVPESTPEALAEAIRTLDGGQDAVPEMRAACRREYQTKYSLESAAKSLSAAYRHAIEGSLARIGRPA